MREWIGIFEGQGTVAAALLSLLGVCIGAGSMMVYEKSRRYRADVRASIEADDLQ